ncbi:MAG: tetratricopeptide repeat protein [Nitrospirota bacterium]|nr:tetratricopeptide repeat protein [Nitrospirota bacterium]
MSPLFHPNCKAQLSPSFHLGFILVFLFLLACTPHEVQLAEQMVEQENWYGAVGAYRDALRQDPFNDKLNAEYRNVKAKASELHYQRGRKYLKEGHLPESMQEFQFAVGLDPEKVEHHSALADVIRLKEAREKLKDGQKLRNLGRLDEALNAFERAIELDPNLTKALEGITVVAQEQTKFKAIGGSTEPVTLRFQNTRLKQVFEILARTANLNILFEKDVRDDLVTIFTKEMPFNEALTLILATNQLFYQQVGPDTLLIIPNTKQKRQQYRDLMIRTFYLSNAKAKDMANLVRTILETKRVYVNEPLNTIVIRDEPVKIQLAEQIIMANDRRDSEVVLEVEVFEVNRTKNRKLGASIGKQIGAGAFPPDSTFSSSVTDWTYKQLTSIGPDSYLLKFPSSILLDFFKSESDAKTLASPQLRVSNNEKASINVGTKEPILLSTTNTTPNTAVTTSTQSTVTSIEFKDTGVKLDVEPTIHLTGEITIKIKIEVSRIGDQVQLAEGINQFRFGNRTAETTLNMRDGETVILAGLIQEDDRKTRETIPGLDGIPFIQDFFLNDTTKITTEVIISITPRIIRLLTPPNIAKQALWSGTADRFANAPLFARQEPLPVLEVVPSEEAEAEPIGNGTQKASTQTAAVPSTPPVQPQPVTPKSQLSTKTKIVVTPTQVQTGPGKTVRINLAAKAFSNIQKTKMTISYDPALLDFVQAIEGAFFPKIKGQPGMTISAAPQSGTILLQFSRKGTQVNGNGVLAILSFKAKAKGNAPIVIKQPSLTQQSGQTVPVLVQHGLIRIL